MQKEVQEFVGSEKEKQDKGDPNTVSNDTVPTTKSHAEPEGMEDLV